MSQRDSHYALADVTKALDEVSREFSRKTSPTHNRRSNVREPLEAPCTIYFFLEKPDKTASLPGRTRNISRKGMAVLVKRCLHKGEPVEVRLELSGRGSIHMGGLVSFCRYVSDGLHEIGIELMHACDSHIFADNPTEAGARFPWLHDALVRKIESTFLDRDANFANTPRSRPDP